MIYFTSDTHFGEDRTLLFSRRPFSSVFEMDSTMINNWNKTVGEEDIVYHLGDFGSSELAKYLKGTIIFLPGNYEDKEENLERFSFCKEIIEPNHELTYKEQTVKLIHEPDEAEGFGFFLYGHIHKLQMVKINGLNVGTDCHNYTPVSFDDVLFFKNAIENHYDENVFMDLMGTKNA